MAIPKSIWQESAEKARDEGYTPGGAWENLLRKSLQRSRPALVEELGDDLENYIQTQTARALEMYVTMVSDQGMNAEVARELAMDELLGGGGEE
jgi:hypothetical protein